MLSDRDRKVSSYQQLLLLPAPPSVCLPADSRQHPASSRWRVDVMEQREGRVFTVWRTRRATTQRQSDGKKHREGGRGGRTRQLFTTQLCWCAVVVWCGCGLGDGSFKRLKPNWATEQRIRRSGQIWLTAGAAVFVSPMFLHVYSRVRTHSCI